METNQQTNKYNKRDLCDILDVETDRRARGLMDRTCRADELNDLRARIKVCACACVYVCVCVQPNTHTRTRVHTHTREQAQTHAHTHRPWQPNKTWRSLDRTIQPIVLDACLLCQRLQYL